MIVFLLKAAIVLSVLFGFYKLFLQKESFFGLNRVYLLAGLLLTFMLPFVTLPELVNHQGVVDKIVTEGKVTKIDQDLGEGKSEFSKEVMA